MIELILFAGFIALTVYAGRRTWLMANESEAGDAILSMPEQDVAENRSGGIEKFFLQMGFPYQPWLLLAGTLFLATLIFFACLEFAPGAVGLAALATCGVLVIAALLVGDYVGWRTRRFEAALVEAMDLINTALRGSMSAPMALKQAAQSSDGHIKIELQEVVRRLELGLPIEKAVQRMGSRYRSEGVRLFTQALIAKWHTGGDFSELLDSVTKLMRDRVKLRLKVEGQLSGARYAGLFSGLLPYVLIPFFIWKQPQWLEVLLDHPSGPASILAAVFLQAIGYLWLRRVLRIRL